MRCDATRRDATRRARSTPALLCLACLTACAAWPRMFDRLTSGCLPACLLCPACRCERSLYLNLLMRYLEAKHDSRSKVSPALAYSQIQAKLDELTSIKEMYEKSSIDLQNIDQLVQNCQRMRLDHPQTTAESLRLEEGTSSRA